MEDEEVQEEEVQEEEFPDRTWCQESRRRGDAGKLGRLFLEVAMIAGDFGPGKESAPCHFIDGRKLHIPILTSNAVGFDTLLQNNAADEIIAARGTPVFQGEPMFHFWTCVA